MYPQVSFVLHHYRTINSFSHRCFFNRHKNFWIGSIFVWDSVFLVNQFIWIHIFLFYDYLKEILSYNNHFHFLCQVSSLWNCRFCDWQKKTLTYWLVRLGIPGVEFMNSLFPTQVNYQCCAGPCVSSIWTNRPRM